MDFLFVWTLLAFRYNPGDRANVFVKVFWMAVNTLVKCVGLVMIVVSLKLGWALGDYLTTYLF